MSYLKKSTIHHDLSGCISICLIETTEQNKELNKIWLYLFSMTEFSKFVLTKNKFNLFKILIYFF